MFRSKRFIRKVFAVTGVIGISIVLMQCTARPATLPVEAKPRIETVTEIPQATRTERIIVEVATEVVVTTITPTVPTLSPTPDAPILEPAGPGAATNLQSVVDCDRPGESIARLSWTPAQNPGQAQRVDVTIFKNGFETGQFESSELLPPDQSSLDWEELSPGLNHRWRVLTLQPEGWVPSEIAIFKGPICVGGEEEESIPTPVIR